MTDPNTLTRPASQWFGEALREHVRENPGQLDDMEALIASGRARCCVLIELTDPPSL